MEAGAEGCRGSSGEEFHLAGLTQRAPGLLLWRKGASVASGLEDLTRSLKHSYPE